jgi:hypothetical protein
MSMFEQIIYRAPGGPGGIIVQVAASVTDPAARGRWLNLLDPWLRAGGPLGRGYLRFGAQAALVRWHDASSSGSGWQFAHVVAGQADQLTAAYALRVRPLPAKLPVLPQDGKPLQRINTDQAPLAPWQETDSRARSADIASLIVPLLAQSLSGAHQVMMPWTAQGLAEAAVWGMASILEALGDTRPFSFVTYLTAPPPDVDGTFVSFRPGAAVPALAAEYETAAAWLARGFAENPAALRQTLDEQGVAGQPDWPRRVGRLLELVPRPQPTADPRSEQSMTTPFNGHQAAAAPAAPPAARQGGTPGKRVICPICLWPIDNWDVQPRWTWDAERRSYKELTLSASIDGPLRTHEERESVKRCPNPHKFNPVEHYLPADYGSFGPPVVLGFIGLTGAGKTHLLASMVGAMNTGLRPYRIGHRTLDRKLHDRFQQERVQRLLRHSEVLAGTREGILTFSDGFVMQHGTGAERPVIMFDVAGGDLVGGKETKRFLDIADGLFFIVDPTQLDSRNGSDETFDNVLDLLKGAGRLPDQVSAAVVVTKADLVRFEEPVTRWLRSDSTTDADDFLRESRDVYAYLHERGASAWTLPFEECSKATLHFASATGGLGLGEGGVYPRGVSPRRVLRPLVAMLSMTGVLNSGDAGKVGI